MNRWCCPSALRGAAAGATLLACLLGAGPGQAQTSGTCQVRNSNLQGSYSGDCVAGLASGRGRAQGKDRYEGGFRDGHATGEGIYTWADGQSVQGVFVNGRLNGRARFHYPNGDTLEGQFSDNRLVGIGQAQRRDGTAYAVELRDGVLVAVAGGAAPVAPGNPAPSPAINPGNPAQANALEWAPRLDFEDFFPSYLLASATRQAPAPAPAGTPAQPAQRALDNPRGDPLAQADASQLLQALGRAKPANTVSARYIGQASDARYLGDPWGVVGIKLRNTRPGARVTVQVSIDEIADPTEATFTLPDVGVYALYPKILYRYSKLRLIEQPSPLNVSWRVSVDGQPAETRSAVARVRTVQDAPLSLSTARGEENMSWVFAGFVTEDAGWIDDLLKQAFLGANQRPVGYQVGPDAVERQVELIYDYLRKRGITYSNIPTTSGNSSKVFSQIVRFPSDSIRTAQANCIDGTVLMASILRKIGIEPLILLGPGHAMLGYLRAPGKPGQAPDYRVVETTMLGGAEFAAAQKSGMAMFDKWLEKDAQHPQFNIINVSRMRAAGVMPIPR